MKFKKLTDKQFNTLVKIFVIFALAYFLSGVAQAAPIKIAVIDTGFDFDSKWQYTTLDKPKLCKMGHKSFIDGSFKDNSGHGTHIVGLIAQGNKDIDYCIVIIKAFEPSDRSIDALGNTIKAYRYAINIGVDIINYSAGGTSKSEAECDLISEASGRGIHVVTAAGNEHSDLSVSPYYPAMCSAWTYKIMAKTVKNSRLPASNYTTTVIPNTHVELGENVLSLMPNNVVGFLTGTSQAAAIFTSKLVRYLYNHRYMYDVDKLDKYKNLA